MPFDRFVWLVKQRRLYMPRVEQLQQNDNFEGTMPRAESAWWDEVARQASSDEKAGAIRKNKETIMRFIRSFRTGWFISCWHIAEHENYMFWEIYGRNPGSIAIVSTFAKLEAALPEHVLAGCVRYIDYETENFEADGDKLPNVFDYIMHKRTYYKDEREVRAVASGHFASVLASDHIGANIVDGSYAPPIKPEALIDDVIVHPRATAEFFSEVTALCSEHGLPTPRLSGLSQKPID